MSTKIYRSTKTFDHNLGISACFRQWRSTHSHCRFFHGYALSVKLTFEANELDERNWVVDFGSLKEVREWIMSTFDHKTVVAADDPLLPLFQQVEEQGGLELSIVDNTGCEAFASLIAGYVNAWLARQSFKHGVTLHAVEVREHSGNSAMVVFKKQA